MARLRRSSETGLDPSGRHRFVEAEDVRPALALYSTRDSQNVSQIAVANATMRAFGCALSGCGRPRGDPIHELSEPAAEQNPGDFLDDSEDRCPGPVWPIETEDDETEDDVTLGPVHAAGTVVMPRHRPDDV